MRWLGGLSAWVVVTGSLLVFIALAYGARAVLQRLVPEELRDRAHGVAVPLMPALGAAFGVLIAITISNENTHLRAAESIVSAEAAASARLAWASTTPGVEGQPIRDALERYLTVSVTRAAWEGTDRRDRDDPAADRALADLERTVRDQAVRKDLSTAVTGELLTSLDSLTNARRDRIAIGSQLLAGFYLLVVAISGAALVVNAGALTLRSPQRITVLLWGLLLVVSLSIALLVAIAAPFRGGLTVSPQPMQQVVDDLRAGFFSPG